LFAEVDPYLNLLVADWQEVSGVIDMDLPSVIRCWRVRQKMALPEIERRSGSSRNTIRKQLRSETGEPEFKVPRRLVKMDPVAQALSG
jgi:hypothetical protein